MATISEARDMGFTFPGGDDLMSFGDDAIQINALAAATGIQNAQFSKGTPAPFDFDQWRTPIVTTLGSPFPEGWINVPEGITTAAVFICYASPTSSWCAQELIQYGGNPRRLWRISRTSAEWNPWIEIGGSAGVGSAMAANAAWQTRWIAATGGAISTGGKAAFALRLDHGLTTIKNTLRDELLARGIRPGIAMNSRTWGEAENSGATKAEVNSWVAAGEVEILNHSATHAGGMDLAGLTDEIVAGRRELETQLPAAAPIWGFAPPGVTQGWDGFNGGNIDGWTSPAAEIILANHAYSLGYVGGARRVLDGTIRQALSHITLDEYSMSAARAQVDAAIAERRGIQVMLHPRELDKAGKITTAQFLDFLDYVIEKRDAGDLVTLTPGELVRADATPPVPAPSWAEVTGKPDTFPPASHTHAIEDVAGLAARLALLETRNLGTAHLDTVTTPGPYHQPFASRATKAQGYPWEGVAGVLDIELWNPANGNCIATYKSWDRGIAKRTLYLGAWRDWLDASGNTIT